MAKKTKRAPRKGRPLARRAQLLPWWDREVLSQAAEHGGFFNAHAHLDRAYTLEDRFLRHIGTTPLEASNLPLPVKQNLVGDLHNGEAYTREGLRKRMSYALRMQIAYGAKRIDTNIDATPDLDEDGLVAINVALELKGEFADRIDVRVAPTPIFGFKESDRWEVFKAAAKKCDYLSLLPEKDDYARGSDPDGRIGFERHLGRGLELGCELGKEVQFHLDQGNTPGEGGTERLVESFKYYDCPDLKRDEPSVKVIHMISPSADSEQRFAKLVHGLLDYNIGVIVCPTAALSMRQMRSIEAPTHNSIARMLELLKLKVPLWLGTDNVADVFVPASEGDMLSEIKQASHAVRMYIPSIWAKLASGTPLNNVDIATIGRILHEDRKAYTKANPAWQAAFD
jgi:cytosine/adenosine deaminase-related metal-dependent hydrolase